MILKNAIRKACEYNSILTQMEYDELMKWAKISNSQGKEACDALATALAMDGRPFRYVRRNEYDEKRYGALGSPRTSSGCFLTTACMQVLTDDFKDDCYELTTLRTLRDQYVSENHSSEVETYYLKAPLIVNAIDCLADKKIIYQTIYKDMILPCVSFYETREYDKAYNLYKDYCLQLEKSYL